MSRLAALLLLFVSMSPLASQASSLPPLLLSGELRAEKSQPFFSPTTDNWRVEVQWLMPEGQVAQPGEIVAVFDGGAIQGEIDSEMVVLETAEEKLDKDESAFAEEVLQKTYALRRAELLLKKAAIDAAVPSQYLSAYEYESYQVAKKQAESAVRKASKELEQAELTREVAAKKQRVKIATTKASLEYKRAQLESMSLRAERAGPVLYGKHPWSGERVFVGMTAQPGWLIAEIPSLSDLYVEAWLHEIDVDRVLRGQDAELVFDAYLERSLPARLADIATQPQKRQEMGPGLYYRLVFKFIEKPELELLPGMGARIEFPEVGK
ncbi:HlyD family secretion protein [Microbulbifer hydrolyticus]|uniref:HlyD family efflux transporter periplasmic adaptor subunit n=1 Tax=Microbulbifer hydrolyticus TaxID=48074 RepID=A0A6P1T9B7_9GAMM|nr:HlyD family efflux transporter periplasmic adaptor subunit [Microbulbifer hydrolyticus]MBB5210086.1 multidrug resistance efflux pump [Microbulbifer hydrolyticus]QHQ39394.1 HlyD family efflux transporter periplasmic adaptor subunit [Microbulbifer hydrolyticus]